MKKYQWFYLLLALFIAGCAGITLDTTNKKFAAFEISYKSVLTEIDSLDSANALKAETKTKVSGLLREVNKTRDLAYLAKNTGNLLEAQNQLNLAVTLLEKLKTSVPKGSQL